MEELIHNTQIQCPFCFEEIWIVIDLSAGDDQQYTQDCEVCCHPINIRCRKNSDSSISVDVDRG